MRFLPPITLLLKIKSHLRCLDLYFGLVGIFMLIGFSDRLMAQPGTMVYNSELGGYVSGSDRLPFWLRANQWGQVALTSPVGTARLGLRYQTFDSLADSTGPASRLRWGFGIEGVGNLGKENDFLLPEAYVKVRWKKWELMAGREREMLGIVDTTLTSGSYSWAGNALPIPKIRLALREYLPLGFLKNFISIKGSYIHGWFNDTYINGAYFHQKTLYGRFGKPEGSFHVQLGLVHNVTWGGSADYLKNNPVAVNGKLTTSFVDYVTGVVLGRIPNEKANSRFTIFDGTNRVGNHVGHYDLAIDWKLRQLRLLVYRQHPFEDASGLQLQNLPDGLYGISVRREAAPSSFFAWKGVVFEFLYTKNQSGGSFDLTGSRFKGLDNYFNHAQYRQGWSYLNRGIGTPFIPASSEVRPEIIATAEYFPTNQTVLYHLGLEGMLLQKVHILSKFSFSSNLGTINNPFPKPIHQFSSLISFDALFLRHFTLMGQIAYDQGGLYSSSLGGYLGVRYSFSKTIKKAGSDR